MYAQRRTTSVKGYTRKDGTYVKPHSRSYNSGSGYSSYHSNESYSSYTSPSSDSKNTQNGEYLTYTSNYNGERIEKSKLNTVQNSGEENKEGNIIYVSVLYYKDQILDICPVPKNIIDNWEFKNVTHSFDKDQITSDDALDLVSNYGWSISREKIRKNFEYISSFDKGSPEYLTKKIEAIKLQ